MEKQKIAQSVESFFNKVFPDVIASPVLKSYPHLYPNLNIEKQGTQFAKLAKNGKPSSRFLFWLESKLVPQAAHLCSVPNYRRTICQIIHRPIFHF